jgi:hypothetical protein
MIDWLANDYAASLADVTDRTIATMSSGISIEYGRDTGRSAAPPMISAVDLTLWNQDRLLSPENPSSPIYQYIKPGRPMLVAQEYGTEDLYRGTDDYRADDYYRGMGVWPLLTGWTDQFQYSDEPFNYFVQLSGLGSAALLKRKIVSVEYSGTTRIDTCIERVLQAAGWPTSQQVMTLSDSLVTGFWVAERPAWDVLVELLATEGPGSILWEDGFGTLRFQNRNWRGVAERSLTVQATLHDGTSSGLFYTRLGYDPRWDDVVNRVTVKTTQRELQASDVIWKLGNDITPVIGTPQVIKVKPQDPFQNAIGPIITTDYTVSGGTVSISLDWTNGAVATLTVTALTGTPTVSDLQVRGQPFTAVGETVVESTTTSETGEEKTHDIGIWQEIDPAQAKSITDAYLMRYQESRPMITVTLTNSDATSQEQMLNFQISDRVRIINAHLGLDVEAYIERIKHDILSNTRHIMTLSCEPVSAIGSIGSRWDFGLWDTATWGT